MVKNNIICWFFIYTHTNFIMGLTISIKSNLKRRLLIKW